MTQKEEEQFIKQAFQALIDRGVAKPEYFTPSPISDDELSDFERRFQIKLPSLLKTFLKTYCYDFNYIQSPLPLDISSETISSETSGVHALWLDLLSVPKADPLRDLTNRIEVFRDVATDEDLIGMKLENVAHLLPIGDWYAGAGPLCIDLSLSEDAVRIENPETWLLCWFDHEEFDWVQAAYLDENGMARGRKAVPSFKTILEWYFYGTFDRAFERQEGEKPDYSKYIRI